MEKLEKVEDHMPLVNWVAGKYHKVYKSRYDLDDLVQVGCIGLCKAAESFDKDVGVKFSTFAVRKIKWEILNLIRDDKYYPAPARKRFDVNVNIASLNVYVEEDSKTEFIDALGECENLDGICESLDLKNALKKLSPEERKIVKYYYFEELTQKQLGEILGMHQVQVSRFLKRTLSKLRKYLA